MSIAKTIAAVQRSKQFKNLTDSGLKLVSTDRQLANGTLAFTGKFKVGRKSVKPSYKITANGAVLSNEFVARRVDGDGTALYKSGLDAISQIFAKRIA